MITLNRLLLACGFIIISFLMATSVLVYSGLNEQMGKADIALVLGNKVELNGKPSRRLQARLDKTLELYRAGYFPTIIVSGGIGKEGYDEAEVMRDYLVSQGIPMGSIILDNEGNNTQASAKNTLQIIRNLDKKSVFVISQYFHLPRARLALESLGISPVYSAHADFIEVRDMYSTFREVIGYVSYMFSN